MESQTLWSFLVDYGLAVLPYWWLLTAGTAMGLVDIVAKASGKDVPIPPRWIWRILVAGIIVAQVLVYKDLKTTTEGLSGTLGNTAVMKASGTGEAIVVVELSVTNTGSPTAVQGYGLQLEYDGIKQPKEGFFLPEYAPPSGIPAIRPDGTVALVIKPDDQIWEKTKTPIPTGGYQDGWAIYLISGVQADDIRERTITFKVSFHDVYRHVYHVSSTGKRLHLDFPPYRHPGGSGPFEHSQ